jgi:hypothetical protein
MDPNPGGVKLPVFVSFHAFIEFVASAKPVATRGGQGKRRDQDQSTNCVGLAFHP